MRIAVDAMGTDNRPVPDVAGAVMAAREWGDEICLVGPPALLEAELSKHDVSGLKLEIVPASQDITMLDKPTEAAREKPDSTMHVGLNLVRDGAADAFVSAGNTGGLLTVATLYTVKRIRGIKRPALTAIIPTIEGRLIAADIGANADCKPEFLVQFAQMASLYAELALGIERPRVALLSNGEEDSKGNELVKATFPLLKAMPSLNFIGNAEPKELLTGMTDVVIHDGFTGNVFIKSSEAAVRAMRTLLRQEIRAGLLTSLGGMLAKPAFERVSQRMNEEVVGGAPLLGLDGIVISAHGRSTALAMKNAILRAREAVGSGLLAAIKERVLS
ncbi:MAG: phosphate acyltransferase PlsX [Anaerolineae bacterium]